MRVATCARGGERLAAALAPLAMPPDRLLAAPCDVLDQHGIEAFVYVAAEALGPIDVLVCNAGRGRMAGFLQTAPREWRDELDLKFFSVLNPLWALLPGLREQGGSVVVVNSLLALEPETHMAATGAARAGLLNLARVLSHELAPSVRVNSVLLGLIESEQWRSRHLESGGTESEVDWLTDIARERRIPLGRLGRPEEVADLIAFLASPRASYISGAAVEVAGGQGRAL